MQVNVPYMDGMGMEFTGKDSAFFLHGDVSLLTGSEHRVIFWGDTPTLNGPHQVVTWDVSKWFMTLSINSHLQYLECVENVETLKILLTEKPPCRKIALFIILLGAFNHTKWCRNFFHHQCELREHLKQTTHLSTVDSPAIKT